jgi:metal-dependent amidase/aminoacylase/carboxypeptidase family protein
METTAHIRYWDGYPATVNTPEWAEQVCATSPALLGNEATPEIEPSLGGEDFSRFLLEYPSVYFHLGVASLDDEEKRQLTYPRFGFDEAALPIGTELMAQLAVGTLYQLADTSDKSNSRTEPPFICVPSTGLARTR